MTHLSEQLIPSRQALAFGRASDAVSGAGLRGIEVQLEYRIEAHQGRLPADITVGPDGWFAVHLAATALDARLALAAQVELILTLAAHGYPATRFLRTVPGSHFAIESRGIDGRPGLEIAALSGAPLDFSIALAPQPVALRGIVLYDHDPSDPVPGATLRADPAPAVTADHAGRFFIPALPVAGMVPITVSDGTHAQTHRWPVDFGLPVNVATLSLTQSNVENDHA